MSFVFTFLLSTTNEDGTCVFVYTVCRGEKKFNNANRHSDNENILLYLFKCFTLRLNKLEFICKYILN